MRPKNNKALTWEAVRIDPQTRTGWFKLDQHKNVNKGSKRGGNSPTSWSITCSPSGRRMRAGSFIRTLRAVSPVWTSASGGTA
jgi:hypothetical protein